MLAWSEGTDNGTSENRNHDCDVIVGGELFAGYSDRPRKLVAKPKLKSTGAGRYASFRWWDAYRKQLGLKDFSPKKKSRTWHLRQIKERGALRLIVVISVRQSTVAAISGLLPGAGYGRFEHKADSLIAEFKEAGGTIREIDV